jgi:hypothetical protein
MSLQPSPVQSPPRLALRAAERLLSGCLRPLAWQGAAVLGVTLALVLAFCRSLSDVPLWLLGSMMLAPASICWGTLANGGISFLLRWTQARSLRRTCSIVGTILTGLSHLWTLLDAAWIFGIGPKPPFSSSRQLGAMLDGFAGYWVT